MTPPSDPPRPPRLARYLANAIVTLVVLGTVAFLGASAVAVWFTSYGARAGMERKAAAELAATRQAAAANEATLVAAAADGQLTDAEIAEAVGTLSATRRSATELVVVARHPLLCFSYTFTLPLGPGVRVARAEIASCPQVSPR